MTREIILNIALTLQGPVLTASSQAGDWGIDVIAARDCEGRCILPESLVHGVLYDSLNELEAILGNTSPPINVLFGAKSDDAANTPQRGQLILSDFILQDEESFTKRTQTRIARDEECGAVNKGAHVVTEQPVPPGCKAVFKGQASVFWSGETPIFANTIKTGLLWVPKLGGNKSIGFGRILKVEVSSTEKRPETVSSLESPDSGAITLRLTPDRPFCIAKPRTDLNLFTSENHIPGSVIKGCMANTLNALAERGLDQWIDGTLPPPWKELGTHFDKIRVEFAFPTHQEDETSPLGAWPLSLARLNQTTYDFIDAAHPSSGMAPAFQADWKDKDFTAVEQLYLNYGLGPIITPASSFRGHTAIENGRAKDKHLFGYEMAGPKGYAWVEQDGSFSWKEVPCSWKSRVDISSVPNSDRNAVYSQLEALFNFGLRFLGKTKAKVQVETQAAPSHSINPNGPWIVLLHSPALMLNPQDGFNDALSQDAKLFELYNQFWKSISGNSLGLKNFFAKQQMLGGHLHYRFRSSEPYAPYLVTSPGSVFLLEQTGDYPENAVGCLDSWLRKGLPLPQWAIEQYSSINGPLPFNPLNGFGHVTVDHDVHSIGDRPSQEEVANG